MLNREDKNNFKIVNDAKAIDYLNKIDKLDKEIQQVNQYQYSRFDNGCVIASAVSIIGTIFGVDPNEQMLRDCEREASRRGWDLWEDWIPTKYVDDAAKMVVSFWNSINPEDKVLFLQDRIFSPTRLLASSKWFPFQYVVRTTKEWRSQKKTWRVTDPKWKVVSWHALFGVYDTEEKEMTFYDSNEWRIGDEFKVSKEVLQQMMKDFLISPICRLYLPYDRIHMLDPEIYKQLQMYKNVSVEMASRVWDKEFLEAVNNLNLVIDDILWEK